MTIPGNLSLAMILLEPLRGGVPPRLNDSPIKYFSKNKPAKGKNQPKAGAGI
jgi:hypothetical protein